MRASRQNVSLVLSPPAPRPGMRARRRSMQGAGQQRLMAIGLCIPGLALLGIVVLYPLAQTLQLSFYQWDGLSPNKEFVGLATFRSVVKIPGFEAAVIHSLVWGVVAALVCPWVGLVAATLVEGLGTAWAAVTRLLIFLPYFFSLAVGAAIFARVYDPSYGLIDRLLAAVGVKTHIQWLGDPRLALLSAIGVFVWHETGFCFIIYTAAIRNLDTSVYDAAQVDGANRLRIFWHITVPSLRSITTFVTLVMGIGGFTGFAVIFSLTTPDLGSPNYSTEILPTLIFKQGIQGYNASGAAALGVILALSVLILSLAFSFVRKLSGGES